MPQHVSCILNGCGYRLPRKGDIIKIKDAYKTPTGNIDINCRVLNVDRTAGTIEVMWLGSHEYLESCVYQQEQSLASGHWQIETQTDPERVLQTLKYAGSDLDTYMNTTVYNTFTDRVKASIVPNNKTQYAYDYTWWASTVEDPDFILYSLHAYPNTTGREQRVKLITSAPIGERYVYSIGLKDVIDYLNPSHGATIQGTVINNFLFGKNDPTPDKTNAIRLWTTSDFLSSYYTEEGVYHYNYQQVDFNSYYGVFDVPSLAYTNSANTIACFKINLTGVDWDWA